MTIELDKPYYRIKDLADLLSVSDDTIRRRIKLLKIKPSRDGRQLVRLHKSQAQRIVDRIIGSAAEK